MLPGKFALTLYRGDSQRWQFKLWADAEKTDPVDLTGVVAAAQIRDKPGGSTVVDLDVTVTQPNIIDAVLTAAKAATLPAKGQWDLQLTYESGDVATVLAGAVTVTADITTGAVTGTSVIEPHQQARLVA